VSPLVPSSFGAPKLRALRFHVPKYGLQLRGPTFDPIHKTWSRLAPNPIRQIWQKLPSEERPPGIPMPVTLNTTTYKTLSG
jgi:hypothetical protein